MGKSYRFGIWLGGDLDSDAQLQTITWFDSSKNRDPEQSFFKKNSGSELFQKPDSDRTKMPGPRSAILQILYVHGVPGGHGTAQERYLKPVRSGLHRLACGLHRGQLRSFCKPGPVSFYFIFNILYVFRGRGGHGALRHRNLQHTRSDTHRLVGRPARGQLTQGGKITLS